MALYRNSGQQAWVTKRVTKIGSDFVNVTMQDERLYAAAGGEVFCLDPFTGELLWHNPLRGYGVGLVTMAFAGNSSGSATAALAEKIRQSQAAAAAAAA